MEKAAGVVVPAYKRAVLGKQVKQLRRNGLVPGVLYGHSFEAQSLQFDAKMLGRLVSRMGGSQLVAVQIDGQEEPERALLREVQRDVLSGEILHVDFYRVRMDERLTAEIPLVILGESPIVTTREGLMLQGVSVIEVECLPGDLVEAIEIDVSELVELDQSIFIRDLAVPEKIDVLSDPDVMVVRVVPIVEEEIIEEELGEEEVELEEVEVVGGTEEEEEPED